jgi:hypothetical protein
METQKGDKVRGNIEQDKMLRQIFIKHSKWKSEKNKLLQQNDKVRNNVMGGTYIVWEGSRLGNQVRDKVGTWETKWETEPIYIIRANHVVTKVIFGDISLKKQETRNDSIM